MARRRIMLFASEVPVISALNPFRAIEDVFAAAWKRTDAAQLRMLQDKLQVELATPEERGRKVVEELHVEAEVDALLQEASKANNAPDVAKVAAKIERQLPVTAPAEVKQQVVQFVRSEMHKGFGVKHEPTAILQYERERHVVVAERNLEFFKKSVAKVGDVDVLVGGKIDGRARDKVVEVKTRLHRFPPQVPRYDVAQLQTYLYILDAKEAELVEYLREDEAQTRTTQILWDAEMWNKQLAPFLLQFSRTLIHFMGSEKDQIKFLTGDATKQRQIVQQHWMESLKL